MRILGIDPGTTSIGYALMEARIPTPHLLHADCIPIRARENHERLKELYHAIQKIAREWKPDAVAVEKLFFAKNAKTAFLVSEARGVALLTSALAGLRVFEYTPLEVKMALCGDGRADKAQVKKMIQLTFKENAPRKAKDDVFDAIAIACTLCFKERLREKIV